jgi:protoporphyrinogen oxidase
MTLRPRKSRIYYLRQFFDYPVSVSLGTLRKLGFRRTCRIGASYLKSALFPISPEKSLEEFFINRFGRELYRTFFKSYTEKVWGVPCDQISAEWGAQRIKGLSVLAALRHALKSLVRTGNTDIGQKQTETSLIEQFLYPRHGPGQLWEEVARRIREMGGEIHMNWRVDQIITKGPRVLAVEAINDRTKEKAAFEGEYFFSSAPVKEVIGSFVPSPPQNVSEVAEGLLYRDFITVGLLVRSLRVDETTASGRRLISDNWIYIQEPEVRLGRLQIFNNWSPHLVKDQSAVWLGLEYFCDQSDEIWRMPDEEVVALAIGELSTIQIVDAREVLDSTVIRMEKTYPAYFGTYQRFGEIRQFVDQYENLFLVGRNGMHRYNNQDHSMLTAMAAVDCIAGKNPDRLSVWDVNTESSYHETMHGTSKPGK